jgi:ABC-type nitrate/sulfonate/bicarbonate transport system substrate-binding protein
MALPRLLTVIILSFLFLPSSTSAQEKLRIAYAGGPSVVPLWIVDERGLLKKQNIQAEMIQINASPAALQAMLAGEVDVNVASVTTLVSARLAGADVVMLMAIVPTFPNYLMTGKTVTSVQELRGKTGGVNRFGAVTDLGMRLVLRKFGLDPERDVRLIPVGGTSQAIAALARGVIQFSLSNEPFVREAEKLGFKSLVDVGSLKIPFHWNGVLTREATVRSKRAPLARFVRAMTEAIYIYKTEKEWTKTVIGKYLRMNDPESVERTYQSFSGIFPEAPFPTADGVKTLLDDLAGKNSKAAGANPKEYVDGSFVEELQRSGFITRLYNK